MLVIVGPLDVAQKLDPFVVVVTWMADCKLASREDFIGLAWEMYSIPAL